MGNSVVSAHVSRGATQTRIIGFPCMFSYIPLLPFCTFFLYRCHEITFQCIRQLSYGIFQFRRIKFIVLLKYSPPGQAQWPWSSHQRWMPSSRSGSAFSGKTPFWFLLFSTILNILLDLFSLKKKVIYQQLKTDGKSKAVQYPSKQTDTMCQFL